MSEFASGASSSGPEPTGTVPREPVWLAVGALVGVIVAGVVIGALVVLGNRGGTPSSRPLPTTSAEVPGAAADAPIGTARDDSLRLAEDAGVTLNTLDYRTAAQTFDAWEALAAAPFLDDLKAGRDRAMADVQKAKTASTAKVLAAAVVKVAADASSADVLVAVEVKTTDGKGTATTKHVRDQLTITQTAQGWKISAVLVI